VAAGELLLSKYRRADDAITTPAVRAVAQLQQRRLSRSLDCAYVRPLAVDGRPAYAAFDNTALRDRCIEMRKILLKHPARMQVEYETVLEVDREYAEALRGAGVPTTPAQRAAAKLGRPSAARRHSRSTQGSAASRGIRPLQGGLPFDPDGGDEKGRSWLGPAILGGAALATTIGIAIGVSRRSRASARM
jgi:hypothetical protein